MGGRDAPGKTMQKHSFYEPFSKGLPMKLFKDEIAILPDEKFFISYTQADRQWAEWIAWQLEETGYTIIIQAWDFYPVFNFIQKMHEAIKKADTIITVISPDFFTPNIQQLNGLQLISKANYFLCKLLILVLKDY
jgi:hypothetical protein